MSESKSELKRLCTLDPVGVAHKMWEQEQQITSLQRENAELKRIIAESKEIKPVGYTLTEEQLARTDRRIPVVWINEIPKGQMLYTSTPIQDGMVAVPIEPTEKMVDAVHKTLREYDKRSSHSFGWTACKAMIEASKEK